MGIKVVIKDYDGRYDAAQTASLRPGIKAELNPVAIIGVGGPDVAALQGRLPTDKVPMFMSTAAYGFRLETRSLGIQPASDLWP